MAQFDALLAILEPQIKKKTTNFCELSVQGSIYCTVLCAVRRSGWTWQSPFWIFACTVALNCQNTSQNACYGYEKRKKSNPIRIFLCWTKIFEAVCKRDWHKVRSYLFFNVLNFRTQCAMTLLHTSQIWHCNTTKALLTPLLNYKCETHLRLRMTITWTHSVKKPTEMFQ